MIAVILQIIDIVGELQICTNDEFTPMGAALEAEKRFGKYAEVKHYPIGHFDIYFGNNFEKSVSDQLEFFKSIFKKLEVFFLTSS